LNIIFLPTFHNSKDQLLFMKRNIIGLMSGTSCDGLDIVLCQFDQSSGGYSSELMAHKFIPYDLSFSESLKNAIHLSSADLHQLHHSYGDYLGLQVNLFVEENNLDNVDWVSSHGHTVLHQPAKGYTFQIGYGGNIKQVCGIPVVCDFRVQDVVLGGQGAPLVPVGDQFLYSSYAACVNLGGFSNVSLVKDDQRIAFDISPFNILMNPLAQKLGFEFDKGGEIAESGQLNVDLLRQLNEIPYYKNQAPKSLSLEDVYQYFDPIIGKYSLSVPDLLHTLLCHFVEQLIDVLPAGEVLITGGGAKNSFFIQLLKERFSGEVIIPDERIVDFKEAIVFAFLAYLKLENKINVLASVTGASKDHSSGCIFN